MSASSEYFAKNRERLNRERRLHYYANHEEGKAAARRYRLKHPERAKACQRASQQKPKGKFHIYRRNAFVRGLEFSMTLEDFMAYWQKPCFYCEDAIPTVGLDRVDNAVGYVVGNVVPCCRSCNIWKLAKTQEDFVTKACKIADTARKRGIK